MPEKRGFKELPTQLTCFVLKHWRASWFSLLTQQDFEEVQLKEDSVEKDMWTRIMRRVQGFRRESGGCAGSGGGKRTRVRGKSHKGLALC